MSGNFIKLEKIDESDVNMTHQDEVELEIDRKTHQKQTVSLADPLTIFTLLIEIKEQLNTIQKDVKELKQKVGKIEANMGSQTNVGMDTSSRLNDGMNKDTRTNTRIETSNKRNAEMAISSIPNAGAMEMPSRTNIRTVMDTRPELPTVKEPTIKTKTDSQSKIEPNINVVIKTESNGKAEPVLRIQPNISVEKIQSQSPLIQSNMKIAPAPKILKLDEKNNAGKTYKVIREIMKPEGFPNSILFDNFSDLDEFDELLNDCESDYAVYFTEFIKLKLRNLSDYKPFMRLGFNLLMTKDLQSQCSYTGKGGFAVTKLNCVRMIQDECRARFNMDDEEIKRYCRDYFSNVKYINKVNKKIKLGTVKTINGPSNGYETDQLLQDMMDIEQYNI